MLIFSYIERIFSKNNCLRIKNFQILIFISQIAYGQSFTVRITYEMQLLISFVHAKEIEMLAK